MRFSSTKSFRGTARLLTLFALAFAGLGAVASAQIYTDLHDINPGAGDPSNFDSGRLAQGRDGNLYAESASGGTSGAGTVFMVTPSGTLTIINSLNGTDGSNPHGGLTLGSDGNFYGDAVSGGASNDGTLFKLTPSGTLTVLHTFTNTGDFYNPYNAEVMGTDGNFYGTTNTNPASIYKVTPAGVFKTIHVLTAAEGYQGGQLTLGSDGNFYGAMNLSGAHNFGTAFKVTPAGVLTVLHNFTGTDGADAASGMVQASNGKFYGAASLGGTSNAGVIYTLTPSGTYTILHNLNGTTDGFEPFGELIAATDGTLYGTTNAGGSSSCGTIFKVTLAGVYSVVYNFDNTHGCNPREQVIQSTNGLLYGLVNGGGAHGAGAFYSFNIGAAPFLQLALTSGKAGDQIGMFGQGFSSSSVVKFGGVPATSITLTGSTYIVATVPVGALTGKVTVTTGSTTLTSTQSFTVHDSWTSGTVMPTPVQGPATGAVGSKVFVVGGATSSAVVNLNQIYNTATNKWTTGAPMPTARFVPASAVVNGILYVIGGCDASCATGGGVLSAVEAYNPTTNTWTTKAPLPTATDSVTAVVASGSIYVIGGYVSGPGRVATVFRYNPALNAWSTEAPMLVAKSDVNVGLLGSTIVAAGGLSNSGVTGDNEGFTPSKDLWTTLVADPTARTASCTAAISGQLYVAGGFGSTSLSLLESFNATTKKWTTLAPMPQAVVVPGNATVGNLLYCFGGSSTGGIFVGTVYNNVQIYRP